MTSKEIFIDFINLIFAILVIGSAILYFIAGDNFESFKRILESIAPIGMFTGIFLVKFKRHRGKIKKRMSEGNLDLTLYLTFMDKAKSDLVVFLLPISVCLLAFMINKQVTKTDFLQSLIVFLIAYWWKDWLFKKERL